MDSAIHGKGSCLMCRERHPLRLALESGDIGCREQGATEATEGIVVGAAAGEMMGEARTMGEAGSMGEKDTERGRRRQQRARSVWHCLMMQSPVQRGP
jgi:hypothetical protein